ncbi:putative pyridoxal kinase [Streptococcus ictaluri 707-05]|uniref:Pyridoxal kinase n=1 Tax=Streptococcus ictaluri 707-05 TaxID=764299 RepID=G5K563_9STRE|nr:putative pyridoxal kinase [Streptococcus ictaluri 707-05]
MEAEILSQIAIRSLEDMRQAAKKIYDLGAKTVVIKGGNRFSQDKAFDLFYDGQAFHLFDYPILPQNNIGAGCTFASSIASHLVNGHSILEAIKLAKDFVYQAILHSDHYGVKQHYEEN